MGFKKKGWEIVSQYPIRVTVSGHPDDPLADVETIRDWIDDQEWTVYSRHGPGSDVYDIYDVVSVYRFYDNKKATVFSLTWS